MASAGARACNAGLTAEPAVRVQGAERPVGCPPPPEADEVFVYKTVIFNGSAAVLHEMMYYICIFDT